MNEHANKAIKSVHVGVIIEFDSGFKTGLPGYILILPSGLGLFLKKIRFFFQPWFISEHGLDGRVEHAG